MTTTAPRHPPIRLDQGGHEPLAAGAVTGGSDDPQPERTSPVAPARTGPDGWTGGRVVTLVVGSLVVLAALMVAGAGATLAVVDHDRRDSDGFLMSPAERLETDTFAIASEDARVQTDDVSAWLPDAVLGDVRLEAGSADGGDLFLGIARSEDAAAYLAGVGHDVVTGVEDSGPVYEAVAGREPALQTLVGVLLAAAALLLLLGAVLVAVPLRLASRAHTEGPRT